MNKNKVLLSNVVSKKALRKAQQMTLQHLKDVIINCAGPYGSNTSLVHDKRESEYSKDGFTILKEVKYVHKLENNIKDEMVELARHIKHEVGDGSTSLTVLSSLIFDGLCEFEKKTSLSPYLISKKFKEVTKDIIDKIKENGRECTIDDIYDISMISTNGNEEVSEAIKSIYEQYGMNVFINVEAGIDGNHRIVTRDGTTLKAPYADQAYINSSTEAKCTINNPRIYAFQDPVDTPELASFLDKIIYDNILTPYNSNQLDKVVPTVILAPRLSRDLSANITSLNNWLGSIGQQTSNEQKPPILLITNIRLDDSYDDIMKLCHCKPIHKYIDPKLQEQDIESGKAPTLDTITEFYGTADIVESTAASTQFINPEGMFNHDENGERIGECGEGALYKNLLDFIEKEIELAKENGDSVLEFSLVRRLNALKVNLVDYFIGGINVVDRDCLKSLAKDAVFNCRSAAQNGVGWGANFEAILASDDLNYNGIDKDKREINLIIFEAYLDLLEILYGTAFEDAAKLVDESIVEKQPLNIATGKFDGKVLSSIQSDIVILDSISKILTVIFSANQAIVPEVVENIYGVYEELED